MFDREAAKEIFAHSYELGFKAGEIHALEYVLGISGGFYTSLFDLYKKADQFNRLRLLEAFPDEFSVFENWQNDIDYFNKLKVEKLKEKLKA